MDLKTNFVYYQHSVNALIFPDNKHIVQKDTIAETVIDSVIDKIYRLHKIQQLNQLFKVSILVQESSESDAHYTFKAGLNSPERFITKYDFLFKKNQSPIFYYDTLKDELIEIHKWDAQ